MLVSGRKTAHLGLGEGRAVRMPGGCLITRRVGSEPTGGAYSFFEVEGRGLKPYLRPVIRDGRKSAGTQFLARKARTVVTIPWPRVIGRTGKDVAAPIRSPTGPSS